MGSFCFLQSFCLPKSVFVVLFLFWLFYFYRALLVPWRLCQRYLNWLTWRLSTHEPSMAAKQTLLWQPRTHKIFRNREGWSSLNVISCWKCWEKKVIWGIFRNLFIVKQMMRSICFLNSSEGAERSDFSAWYTTTEYCLSCGVNTFLRSRRSDS